MDTIKHSTKTESDAKTIVSSVNWLSYSIDAVQLPATGDWTTWQTASIEIDFVQSNNLLKLSSLTVDGNPAANWLNKSRTKWGTAQADVVLSYQQTNGGWTRIWITTVLALAATNPIVKKAATTF